MFDRFLIAVALLVLLFLWPAVGGPVVLLTLGLIVVVAVGSLLWESLAWTFASPATRALLRLRHLRTTRWTPFAGTRRRALVDRLVQRFQLRLDGTDPDEPARLAELSRAVHAANVAAPTLIGDPLAWADVTAALVERHPHLDAGWLNGLEAAPRAPEGLRRRWLRVRAAISPWIPGARLADLRVKTALLHALTDRRPPHDDLPSDPSMKERILAAVVWQAATRAALPVDIHTFAHLPLHAQRAVVAATQVLYGTTEEGWLAGWCHPSVRGLSKLADLRAAHDRAMAKRAADHTAREAEAKRPLSDDEIATALVTHRIPGIYLRRDGPVAAAVRSHLGGLPGLPDDEPWPRHDRTGLPLHFLAQIACDELPDLGGTSPLPRTGALLFFADLDEERLYEPGDGSSRVVYVPTLAPPRAPPDDLPPIDHAAGHPRGHGPRTFDAWPVSSHPIDTWTVGGPSHTITARREYTTPARAAFEAAKEALLPPAPTRAPAVRTASDLPTGFPWCGEVVHALHDGLATDLAAQHERLRHLPPERAADTRTRILRLTAALGTLTDLLPASPRLALTAEPTVAAWILAHPEPSYVAQHAQRAIVHTVRRAVTDPVLRALLPDAAFQHAAAALTPRAASAEHVLLGAAQHKTNETTGEGLRLLVLDSDPGMDFMFCDCGVIEYWIRPEDLAAGRWDRAVAHTAGG